MLYLLPLFSILLFLLPPLANTSTPLSNKTLQSLPRPGPSFNIHTGSILSPFLRPRVPGSPGSHAVQQHITNFFQTNLANWTIEQHTTSSRIPVAGSPRTPFTNIIVSRYPPGHDPQNTGRITLAAHYDSLREPEGFIGAIDSAAPCAMLLQIAKSIDEALTRKWTYSTKSPKQEDKDEGEEGEELGIQILFLDGEETFGNTLLPNDGLYGSRALAAQWAVDRYSDSGKYESRLGAVEMFVLLDLLGAKDPTVSSYYPFTHGEYQSLAGLEGRLLDMELFSSQGGDNKGSKKTWFVDRGRDARNLTAKTVEDDQVPFSALGVPVLHVIDADPGRNEFPSVWHTMEDDGEHLDLDTLGDWSVLMTAFVTEWLGLEGYFV